MTALLSACGGGGGSGDGGGDPGPGGRTGLGHLPGSYARPDAVLLLVSGHTVEALVSHPSYLDDEGGAGPYLLAGLQEGALVGQRHLALPYRDGSGDGEDQSPGLRGLIADLEFLGREWPGVRVLAVGHSHGCPRLVHAISRVPTTRVDHLVLLDGNATGMGPALHDDDGETLAALTARRTVAQPGPTTLRSGDVAPAEGAPVNDASHDRFDRGDVIPWNVTHCREVRLGAAAPLCAGGLAPLDLRWNVRPDGSTAGLSGRVSGTDTHCSVDDAPPAGGALATLVLPWLRARLAAPRSTGSFDGGTRHPLRAGDVPSGLLLADVDRDGLADVLVPLANAPEIAVLRSVAGPGSILDETDGLATVPGPRAAGAAGRRLGTATFVAAGLSAEHLIAADFDRDGAVDLAAASGDADAVTVLYGDGVGGFAAPVVLGGWADRPVRLVAPDVDRDGYPDLVALGAGCTVESARNRSGGPRAWGGYRSYGVLPSAGDGLSLVAADVDRDGLFDLVAGHLSSGPDGLVTLLRGRPSGLSLDVQLDAPGAAIVRQGPGLRPSDLLAIDLHGPGGDGPLDLVCLSGPGGDLLLLEGDGAGGFPTQRTTDGNVGEGPNRLAYGDFDGDGQLDVVQAAGSAAVVVAGGAVGFPVNLLYLDGTLGDGAAERVAVGDVDGDGRLDVLAAGPTSPGVTVFLGR